MGAPLDPPASAEDQPSATPEGSPVRTGSRAAGSSAAQKHDAECEIDNGAVGFDGMACLCADRAKASAAYPHADVILRVLASEATTPEPDSWGGDRAAARDEVYKFAAELDRIKAEIADLKKRLGYPRLAR